MKDKINKILRKISMALLVDPLYLLRGEREYCLVGDVAVDDDAVGGLDEAEGVDAPEGLRDRKSVV